MAGESSQRNLQPSKLPREQLCRFGTVVRTLWPIKPALRLAQAAGCTERHASLVIRGERKPNAQIALVVFNEIIN